MDGFFLTQAPVPFEAAHNHNPGTVGQAVIQVALIPQVVREGQGAVCFVDLAQLCRDVGCLDSLAVPSGLRTRLYRDVFEQRSSQGQNGEQKYDSGGACNDEQLFSGHWYLRVASENSSCD